MKEENPDQHLALSLHKLLQNESWAQIQNMKLSEAEIRENFV